MKVVQIPSLVKCHCPFPVCWIRILSYCTYIVGFVLEIEKEHRGEIKSKVVAKMHGYKIRKLLAMHIAQSNPIAVSLDNGETSNRSSDLSCHMCLLSTY